MTFGGGNLRGQNTCGVAKPVTAENSGHSNNQLIFNLLNTPILRKMDSSDCFPSTHTPHQMSYLRPAPLYSCIFIILYFAVLWIMAIVSISYYIVLLLEDSLAKLSLKVDTTVSYGYGFYLFAASGGVALVGIFYNLIVAHHPVGYYREDDRCLIGFDDGLDTFNSPTPPPPYNVPPPPYTP
jgi:hypothetical protein